MSTTSFEILDPGLLTTVQDRGRYGYQRYGVPVSGAMDEFALRMANIMAGNDQNAAALEVTVRGPKMEFHSSTWIAVTGADISPEVDGRPIPMWESVEIEEGSVLEFGDLRDGMRAYVAVRGGIDVPVVMGSRSTYLKGRFGGLKVARSKLAICFRLCRRTMTPSSRSDCRETTRPPSMEGFTGFA